MGFHFTDTLADRPQTLPGRSRLSSNRRQVQPATPSKNSVWDFFSTFTTSVWNFVTQPVEPHREISATFTISVSDVRYYGFRYYAPQLGRFINTDPINEYGFVVYWVNKVKLTPNINISEESVWDGNQYVFCVNSPAFRVDVLGLFPSLPSGPIPCNACVVDSFAIVIGNLNQTYEDSAHDCANKMWINKRHRTCHVTGWSSWFSDPDTPMAESDYQLICLHNRYYNCPAPTNPTPPVIASPTPPSLYGTGP